MWDRTRHPELSIGRYDRARKDAPALPVTADDARGSTNLASIPRAGNISSDTRAGLLG